MDDYDQHVKDRDTYERGLKQGLEKAARIVAAKTARIIISDSREEAAVQYLRETYMAIQVMAMGKRNCEDCGDLFCIDNPGVGDVTCATCHERERERNGIKP